MGALRDELEKSRIGEEERTQNAVVASQDEIIQLKDTANALRDELEATNREWEEKVQKMWATIMDRCSCRKRSRS